jgi:hypothetical protein
MATGYETILAEVERRLTVPKDFVPGSYGTRRGHLTVMPREAAPGAHIVGGDDKPATKNNCGKRSANFTVAIYTRNNDGSKTADPYLIELYARMAAAFPVGVSVTPGAISRETEIADSDAARTDCTFDVTYRTGNEWSLELQS